MQKHFLEAAVALSLLVASAASSFAETAMFRQDASRSGISKSTPATALHLKWIFKTAAEGKQAEPIYSSPVVAQGILYIGSTDNSLYAINAATGEKKWQFKTQGGPFNGGGNVSSTPAIANGLVYFMCADGSFYAVDATSGELRWKFETGGERRFTAAGMNYTQPMTETTPEIWDFYLSSPAVVGNDVYFGCGDSFVYCLDAKTGALRWKFKTGDVVHASPAVAGDTVYIGSYDTYFYALGAADGKLRWKFKTGDDEVSHNQTGISSSAVVSDGTVYFGCRDNFLYALNAKTGTLSWKFANNKSWVIGSPAVVDNVVYYSTSDALKFEALDAKTGKELYSLRYGTYAFSSPTIAGNTAYFGTFAGQLLAVDLTQHAYSAKFTVPGHDDCRSKSLTATGELRSDLFTGETIEDAVFGLHTKILSMGSILSTPWVEEGVVYFGSADGCVYALTTN